MTSKPIEYLLTDYEIAEAIRYWLGENKNISITLAGTLNFKPILGGGYRVIWTEK